LRLINDFRREVAGRDPGSGRSSAAKNQAAGDAITSITNNSRHCSTRVVLAMLDFFEHTATHRIPGLRFWIDSLP
jgi:hypothetical protein